MTLVAIAVHFKGVSSTPILLYLYYLRLLQNSLSSPKCSIGDMVSYNKTPDSRLNNAGMTIFLYFCKRLT